MNSRDKYLPGNAEAIMIPTGPSDKIDRQRALRGARLYNSRPGRRVIVSGVFNDDRFEGSQSGKICGELLMAGVPIEDIEFERYSEDTLENVAGVSKILSRNGIDALYVATDRDHGRRVSMLFRRARESGAAPRDLKVRIRSGGINRAHYQLWAQAAYGKDLLLGPLLKAL